MKTILIDASHLMYRSGNVFKEFSTSYGYLTGVQFGVARTLESIKKKHTDARIIFVRDGQCAERRQLLPSYKSSRGECSTPQVYNQNTLSDVLTIVYALGCSVAYEPTLECDDVIGILTKEATEGEWLIYSGDQDFHQLAYSGERKKVSIWSPGKKGEERIFDVLAVVDEWGVAPESLPLYRSFVGDTSDEIPRLARIPREPLTTAINRNSMKTPAEFYDYGGLMQFTPEWREKLLDFRVQCETNYRVTRLPFHFKPVTVEPMSFDRSALIAIFERLEFKSFLKKMAPLEVLFGHSHEQIPS